MVMKLVMFLGCVYALSVQMKSADIPDIIIIIIIPSPHRLLGELSIWCLHVFIQSTPPSNSGVEGLPHGVELTRPNKLVASLSGIQAYASY